MMALVIILALSLLSLLPPPIAAAAVGDAPSAYEMLQSFDFPMGLLPKGVTGYKLDESTGKFEAYLNGSCSFSLEGSYQLKYRSTISGYVSKGRLTGLNGISVKILFLWVNIVEVVRVGEDLEFSVGIASADFGIENFEISPQCGCGLNCDDSARVMKIGRSPLVSSI